MTHVSVTQYTRSGTGVLIAVNVEIKVLLRNLVVGTVFSHVVKGFVDGSFQIGVIFTQAHTGADAKDFVIFHRRTGEGVVFSRPAA